MNYQIWVNEQNVLKIRVNQTEPHNQKSRFLFRMELPYDGYLQCECKGNLCCSVYGYSMHVLYMDDILSSIFLLACDIYE